MTSELSLFSLLTLAHVLVEFVFLSRHTPAGGQLRPRALGDRSAVMATALLVVVLPFAWSPIAILWLVLIAVCHTLIAAAAATLDRRLAGHTLSWFLGAQLAQFFGLFAFSRLWLGSLESGPSLLAGQLAAVAAVVVFNARGASMIVSITLQRLSEDGESQETSGGPEGAGRLIGYLERWMVLGLVCSGEWSAVGLVLTAKSIARFKRMDEQAFAETYLVGTMTSVLIAMLSGVLLSALLTG